MSGLMMVFLFIVVVFMLSQQKLVVQVQKERDQIARHKQRIQKERDQIARHKQAMDAIANMAKKHRTDLHKALIIVFAKELKDANQKAARSNGIPWIEIEADNTVRFNAPEVLFKSNKTRLSLHYKRILLDFFLRYVQVLYEHSQDIKGVRIEGHTSSKGSFLYNMDLSQQRAFNTLKYCYKLITNNQHRNWLHTIVGAQGFSFSRPIKNANNNEDTDQSRRVEFRVITKAEERLYQILETSRAQQ